MPVPTDITAGTITITNGSTAVTGVGTSWLASDLRQGDVILWIDGGDGFQTPIIQAVNSNTSITLANSWTGPTLTGVAYRIRYQWDSSRVSAQSRQLIELLDNGNVLALSGLTGPGVPVFNGPHSMTVKPETEFVQGVNFDVQVNTLADRATYDAQTAGFAVLVSDIGDGRSAVYSKLSNASGDWSAAAYITGGLGQTPTVTASATTLAPGASATVTTTPITGGVNLDIGVPAGRSGGLPFTWSTSTTDADPGIGFIRANNASLSAATLLFVSKTNAAGTGVGTFLGSLASSTNPTNKGTITLTRISDGATATLIVTGTTDATNYVKISVTGNSGASAFTNNGLVDFLFARSGDKGADGAGTGDVVGPASAVNDRIAVFSGATGKLLKDGGSTIASLVPADGSITNAKLANMTTARVKGRVTAGTGAPEDLTAAQTWSVLGVAPVANAYARSTILGTVTQASGVPTGAIIERGSTATGEYVRYADGTQICWHEVPTGSRNFAGAGTATDPYRSNIADWTYPAVFSATPRLSLTARVVYNNGARRAASAGCENIYSNQATSIQCFMISTFPEAGDTFAQAIAIGRWF